MEDGRPKSTHSEAGGHVLELSLDGGYLEAAPGIEVDDEGRHHSVVEVIGRQGEGRGRAAVAEF